MIDPVCSESRPAPGAALWRAAEALREAAGGDELVVTTGGRTVVRARTTDSECVVGADHQPVTWTHGLTFGSRLVGIVAMSSLSTLPARSRLMRILVRQLAVGVARELRRDDVIIERATARMTSLLDGTYATDGLRDLTGRVRDVAENLIGTSGAAISVWDDERRLLKVLPGAFGATGRVSEMGGPGTDLRSNAARVFRTHLPYLTNRAEGDPCILQSYVARYGLRRVVSVPLFVADRCIGVLHLSNPPRDLTLRDLQRAELLAPWVATAVELTRTVAALRTRQRLDGMLSAAAVAIASGTGLEIALTPAFASLGELMCASIVAVTPTSGAPFVWERGSVTDALRARFLGAVATAEPTSTCTYPRDARDLGWADFHTPVEFGGRRIAVLSMLRQHGVPVSPDEASALRRLAGLIAQGWAADRDQRQRIELTRLRERQHIADDLHNRVAQILFAAQLGIDSLLEPGSDVADEQPRLRAIRALLTKGDNVIRAVIDQLDPVRFRPAGSRLRETLLDVEEEFGMPAELVADERAAQALDEADPRVVDCVLKVAREATVNAAKHARPTHVRLELLLDGATEVLTLRVTDDGCGFSGVIPRPTGVAGSFGLSSMERAVSEVGGEFWIGPAPVPPGTTVAVLVPLERRGSDLCPPG